MSDLAINGYYTIPEGIDALGELYDRCSDDVERLRAALRRARKLRYMAELVERDGSLCGWCGGELGKLDPVALHIDHIVPRSRGGESYPWNHQLLHAACNLAKGTLPMSAAPFERWCRAWEEVEPLFLAAVRYRLGLYLCPEATARLAGPWEDMWCAQGRELPGEALAAEKDESP